MLVVLDLDYEYSIYIYSIIVYGGSWIVYIGYVSWYIWYGTQFNFLCTVYGIYGTQSVLVLYVHCVRHVFTVDYITYRVIYINILKYGRRGKLKWPWRHFAMSYHGVYKTRMMNEMHNL